MKRIQLKYDILLLDADGTILDFSKAEYTAFVETFQSCCGMSKRQATNLYSRYQQLNDALWSAHERGEITKEALKKRRYELLLDGTAYQQKIEEISHTYETLLCRQGQLLPRAMRALQRLRKKGMRLFLITNGLSASQRGRIHAAGIEGFFEQIFISEEIGSSKPDPAFFEAVAAAIPGYDPERTLVVGDRPTSDLAGAAAVGLPCVWIAPTEAVTGYPYIAKISDLWQLPVILWEDKGERIRK